MQHNKYNIKDEWNHREKNVFFKPNWGKIDQSIKIFLSLFSN